MEKHPRGEKLRPGGAFMKTEIYGSTAQFGKKSQTGFFAPIQSLENEGILYVFQRVKTASQSLPPAGGRLPSLPGYCQIFAKLSALPVFFFRLAFPVNFSLIFHEFPAGDWKF